ncbi:MAG: four-carbon acid sugar kinase family protein [Minwuiales bacterium]|nr:four-carbon acid sugar kinase family protein [Minwuiales bacterium]
MLLGCIADDFTGATDLANTLVRQDMRTVLLLGVPAEGQPVDADAVVVALKSRTIPAGEAVDQSLAALRWLRDNGARQFFFKYCSTFDSTDDGNIGPVAEALLDGLGEDFTIACPAFPTTGRTIYLGHLFVGDLLLSDSSMRDHPLTPMTDSNLVHVLGRQTQGRVGLVHHRTVSHGAAAIAQEFDRLHGDGCVAAIVDAIDDADLLAIGHAAADLKLVTGGSGVAMGLPDNFRRAGLLTAKGAADALDPVDGLEAVIAGSCSAATIGQVAEMGGTHPMFRVDPAALAAGEDVAGAALDWAAAKLPKGPVLIYSTDQPDAVAAVQGKLGRDEAGALVEDAMAKIARGLADAGVRKLVVAGGETSGAVVQALGVTALRIGPEIDPGVPWTQSLGDPPIALALKSGNFGAPDFFVKALRMLP